MARRFTRARLGLASAGAVAGMAFAGISAGSASAASTLRIMYNPNPTNTSIVVAQQQGFFKKNGLNVKLMTSANTAALVPALGKQFDLLTITPTSVLQAAAAGFKTELVGGETIENTKYQSSYIIGAKDITSVKQLKGQKVGVVGLAGVLYSSMLIRLHRAGLTTSDVTFVQIPFADMNADMENGTVQAVVTIYPFQGQMLGRGLHQSRQPRDRGCRWREERDGRRLGRDAVVGCQPWQGPEGVREGAERGACVDEGQQHRRGQRSRERLPVAAVRG